MEVARPPESRCAAPSSAFEWQDEDDTGSAPPPALHDDLASCEQPLAEEFIRQYYRNVSEEVSGGDTTLLVAMSRVLGTRCTQRVGDFAMELLGGLADVEEEGPDWVPLRAMASEWWTFGITATIAAGTTEINKNNIATRGLGLPRA